MSRRVMDNALNDQLAHNPSRPYTIASSTMKHRKQDSDSLSGSTRDEETSPSPSDTADAPLLDLRRFTPEELRTSENMNAVIGRLEDIISNCDSDRLEVVAMLMTVDNLLEFAISAISHDAAVVLVYSVVDQFPTTAKSFSGSLAANLLFRFSMCFWSLNYPAPGLGDSHRAVELASVCLQAISGLPLVDLAVTRMEDDMPGLVAKRMSQKARKRATRGSRPVVIDTKPFDNLGIDVPTSVTEARELERKILDDQLRILQYYFQTLREPELAEIFYKAYISDVVETGDQDASGVNAGGVSVTQTDDTRSEFPAAYPIVQPMKAALYFDTAEGFGDWRIYISTRADGNLRETRKKDPQLFRIIIKKIKELSNGHFSDDNQKRLNGPDIDIPVFEAKMTRDSRLVYQVDCVREFDSDIEWQVLRIFGIYTHAQLDKRFWDAVGHQLGGRGKIYKKRCTFRNHPHHQGDNVVTPASFPPATEPSAPEKAIRIPDLRDEDLEELHSLLVLEKFVTFSQALLNSILADQDVAHVFQMSPQEQEIVQHGSSCYVLGRSGTGKTTTMIFKILGIERTWEQNREVFAGTISRPRQLFVTQSKVLAEKVEEYYAKLSQSLAAEQRSSEESAKLLADKEQKGLVDRDEEDLYRGDLPKRFGELEDKHFPLFITYDQLCRLLEAELDIKLGLHRDDPSSEPTSPSDAPVSNDYMLQQRASFVSYSEFLRSYWPHFPQSLTKRLDPALVFAEFMGVLKGSEQTLHSKSGYLTTEEYENLSHRAHGTFSGQRDAIYALFQAYQRMRGERRHYDAADRTHAIVKNLLAVGIPGRPVDFIYVDEVQDNLLIDVHILRTICNNPNGLFWAGDTAQTISAGSSFRFNDLKAFLYRIEKARRGGEGSEDQPKSFQLITNYRSHNGIVSCAQSVVALITEFWPHAIDVLAEERGVVDGLRPVFFSGWDRHTVRYEQFLFGASGSQIEFGAKQCILVRDDAARDKLRAQVGNIGLILTLYESKGLEFDDVLLYNFFEDSTVDLSQWRVVLNVLPGDARQINCPRFDDTRHSGVCREFLYVAITRARKNLWIADTSERGGPMRAVWDAKGQVQNCTPGDTVPQLATTSTPEEWAQTARILFDNRRYMQAVHSYERAGFVREKDVAYAYHLREMARAKVVASRAQAQPDIARNEAYLTAAYAFLSSAKVAENRQERLAYYRIAAECFAEGDDFGKAGEAYLSAAEYTRSAQHYRKAGMFDEAVDVIKAHNKDIPEQAAEKIMDIAKIHYFTKNKLDQATKLFPSIDEAMEFMEEYEFDVARADLLERNGRFAEAAELHFSDGHVVRAISLLLKDDNETSRKRAEACLLDGLWRSLPFGVNMRLRQEHKDAKSDVLLQDLIVLSDQFLQTAGVSSHTSDQLQMFRHIASRDVAPLRSLGELFVHKHGDFISAMLCWDHTFSVPLNLQNASVAEISETLESFLLYSKGLAQICFEWNPCGRADFQRLFGFQESSANNFLVYHGTKLKDRLTAKQRVLVSTEEEVGIIIRGQDLQFGLKRWIQDHLLLRVNSQTYACHHASAHSPCVAFTVFGDCKAAPCHSAHLPADSLDNQWFHLRIRIIFQQVLIYQTISALAIRKHQLQEQIFWLGTLYQALYPSSHKFGSISLFDAKKIPESEKAIPVVKDWLRNLFYSFVPQVNSHGDPFLTQMGQMVHLAYFFDKLSTQDYMPRTQCATASPPPWLLRVGDRNIVWDLLNSLDGKSADVISTSVLFIQHVCHKSLNIDINVLCGLVEYAIGLYVTTVSVKRWSSLHDVSLPLSWLRKLPLDGDISKRNTVMIFHLMNPLTDLLEKVYTGADHLTYLGASLAKARHQVRNVFIARLCRALCLLGYNVREIKLRVQIQIAINSLRKRTERRYPAIFNQFVQGVGWKDMVRALRRYESSQATGLDEWVQLIDEKLVKVPLNQSNGIRVISFKDRADIPILLNGGTVGHKLRAEAEPFVPRFALLAQTEDDDDGEEEEAAIDGEGETADLEVAASAVDAGRVERVEPTKEEIQAARVFQRVYRRRMRHRRFVAPASAEARARWFGGLLETSKSVQLERQYRLLMLGPLVHVLVCLEKVYLSINSMRKRAIRKLHTTAHRELEEVQEQADKARRHLKDTSRLQKLLGPQSSLHTSRKDVTELKKLVGEAVNLVRGMGTDDWELQTAVKGILKAPPVVVQAKPTKPELVLDEDIGYYV
ncbi:hypothetical protein BXZ70DRAFT_104267, partial [Cristinia sonorae]